MLIITSPSQMVDCHQRTRLGGTAVIPIGRFARQITPSQFAPTALSTGATVEPLEAAMTGVSTALTVCLLHALAGRKRKPEVSQPGGLRRLPGRVGEARRDRVLAEHAILGVGAVAFGAQLSNTMMHDRQVRLVVVDVDVRPKAELVFVQTVDGIEETAAAIEPRSPGKVREVPFVE